VLAPGSAKSSPTGEIRQRGCFGRVRLRPVILLRRRVCFGRGSCSDEVLGNFQRDADCARWRSVCLLMDQSKSI
jgi:hypothetical protein